MSLLSLAIIEVVAIIGLLGWMAWFVWHTRRRDAEPGDLFPPAFGDAGREVGQTFGRVIIEGLASPSGAEKARYAVHLMTLLHVDEEMALDILDTAGGLARETTAPPLSYWDQAYTAAIQGKFE